MEDNQYNRELKRRADRRMVLLDEIAERQEDLKQCKSEDKADGYSEKALAQVIKELRKGPEYQEAQLSLELELDTYRKAVGLPVTLDAAQEAARKDVESLPEDAADKAGRRARGRETVN